MLIVQPTHKKCLTVPAGTMAVVRNYTLLLLVSLRRYLRLFWCFLFCPSVGSGKTIKRMHK